MQPGSCLLSYNFYIFLYAIFCIFSVLRALFFATFVFLNRDAAEVSKSVIVHQYASRRHPNHSARYREETSVRALMTCAEFDNEMKIILVRRAGEAFMKIKRRRFFCRIRDLYCKYCSVRVSIYS